ncbi:MAG: glutamate racemase [Spirochaetia bacterium]
MESYSRPIVFIDSGIGGLKYLEFVRNQYPNYTYVYVADSANFPYGKKTRHELESIFLPYAKHIHSILNPQAVVISCNTATLVGYDIFKENFDCPVLGVQPILNAPAIETYSKPIGILATEASVRCLISQPSLQKIDLHFFPASTLVDFIEYHWISSSHEEKLVFLKPFAKDIQSKNIHTLMLSCTHFSHLKNELAMLLPNIILLDFVQEAGIKLAKELELIAHPSIVGQGKLYQTSMQRSEEYRCFADLFHLSYSGIL